MQQVECSSKAAQHISGFLRENMASKGCFIHGSSPCTHAAEETSPQGLACLKERGWGTGGDTVEQVGPFYWV